MSETNPIHPNYLPPLDRLLTLGQPKERDYTLDYRKLGLADEHIPELLRMVADDQLHAAPGDTNLIWAPVHAWRALEELKAEAAIGPLLGLLERIDDDYDDWVSSEVPQVLGKLGGAALEPVTTYLANPAHGEWARVAAAKALEQIGARHAELRAECVSRLSTQLEQFATQSETLNAFLVSPLLDLEAREALPTIERSFAAGRVDEAVLGDYEAVEIALGLKTQRQRPPQPNALTRMAEKLRAIAAGGQSADASPDAASDPARLQPHRSPEKPGRNDPCPCGSGKKHKKCCGK